MMIGRLLNEIKGYFVGKLRIFVRKYHSFFEEYQVQQIENTYMFDRNVERRMKNEIKWL